MTSSNPWSVNSAERPCIGIENAGDKPERLRSEAAWAMLCGVAPVPSSSGMTLRGHHPVKGEPLSIQSPITKRARDEKKWASSPHVRVRLPDDCLTSTRRRLSPTCFSED